MTRLKLIVVCALLCHPTIDSEYVTVCLYDFKSNTHCEYVLNIPSRYEFSTIIVPAEVNIPVETTVHIFKYPQGQILYIGDNHSIGFRNKSIEKKIRCYAEDYLPVENYFLQDSRIINQIEMPQSWDLSGKNRSRYWRDVETVSWIIGYQRVPKSEKVNFDKIINDFIEKYKIE